MNTKLKKPVKPQFNRVRPEKPKGSIVIDCVYSFSNHDLDGMELDFLNNKVKHHVESNGIIEYTAKIIQPWASSDENFCEFELQVHRYSDVIPHLVMANYEKKLEEYETAKAAYEKAMLKYEQDMVEYQKQIEEIQRQADLKKLNELIAKYGIPKD